MVNYAHDTQHEKIIRACFDSLLPVQLELMVCGSESVRCVGGLAMGVAMLVYGREEQADVLIEQLLRDKVRLHLPPKLALTCCVIVLATAQDPLLRYGGMHAIGMAYVGTGNNSAIRRLLHVAVRYKLELNPVPCSLPARRAAG